MKGIINKLHIDICPINKKKNFINNFFFLILNRLVYLLIILFYNKNTNHAFRNNENINMKKNYLYNK